MRRRKKGEAKKGESPKGVKEHIMEYCFTYDYNRDIHL